MPCLRSPQPESSEIPPVTQRWSPSQKCSRSHSEVLRNASVMLQSDRDAWMQCRQRCWMCAKDTCLKLAFESALSAQGGSASVAPLRGEQVIGRSHRIRGVNQGPDSELVVLFSCELQVVDVALKTCQLGDTQFCVRSKSRFRSRELRQKRHMTLEIFNCNFVKSPPYSTATTPFERGVLHVANASAFNEVDKIRFPYCEQGSNHVDTK